MYALKNDDEVMQVATDFGECTLYCAFDLDLQRIAVKTGGHPVYRYFNGRVDRRIEECPARLRRPATPGDQSAWRGASAEIQFATGNLYFDPRYSRDVDDHKVSETMQTYFVKFVKT